MNIDLLSTLFLLLTAVVALIVLALFTRYLSGKARTAAITLFAAWLLYAGILGYRGVIAAKTPPGPAFLLIPVVLFIAVFLVRHPGVRAFASRLPISLLIGLQAYRVFVEIALYELHRNGLVPRMLTFEGANFDIVTGLSAPLIAYLYATHRLSPRAVRLWCWLGIALLANAVLRALLTFSSAIHTEISNVGIGLFPFTYLPGFLAPLALCLHVLLLRALPQAEHTHTTPDHDKTPPELVH